MTSSASAKQVRFDPDSMWVELSDGRVIGYRSPGFRISSRGLHWESLDEDISIAGLLAGLADQTTDKTFAA